MSRSEQRRRTGWLPAVRCFDEEELLVREKAHDCGMSVGQFMLNAALQRQTRSRIDAHIINELRRGLVLTESRFPEEIQPAFESMERNGSPWAFQPAERGKWAEGMDIPTMAELAERNERPDILFWVGCMGSFDDRAKKVTVAFARILKAAGIRFAILGQEESCHGDPARRMGNEYLY